MVKSIQKWNKVIWSYKICLNLLAVVSGRLKSSKLEFLLVLLFHSGLVIKLSILPVLVNLCFVRAKLSSRSGESYISELWGKSSWSMLLRTQLIDFFKEFSLRDFTMKLNALDHIDLVLPSIAYKVYTLPVVYITIW
jgi:hypothetical protein